jgi:hypothetical protein
VPRAGQRCSRRAQRLQRHNANGSLLIASTRTPAAPRTVRCSRAVRLEASDSSTRNRVTGTPS